MLGAPSIRPRAAEPSRVGWPSPDGAAPDFGEDDLMTEIEERRARQYAICTYALDYDRVTDGAEGVFDQALSNGLAAIVAHAWPGAESDDRGVLSAARLLSVLEERGAIRDDGIVHILRPGEPEWDTVPWEDKPVPNFTLIDVPTLREAISASQAIRHARDAGEAVASGLSDAHIQALRELDHHPALYTLTDEMIQRAERNVAEEDAAERDRALDYWHSLGSEEQTRREAFDYAAAYAWETKDGRIEVGECSVCWQEAFVAEEFDGFLDEIGVGTCIACSYRRSRRMADDLATEVQMRRAVERED